MKGKTTWFKTFGLLFLFVYAVILIRKIPLYGVDAAIWYCDWVMVFAGVGLLLNSRKLLSPLLIQSVMVQTPWLIDGFLLSAFNVSSMNLTNYLFNDYPLFDFVIGLRHFLVIPVLLFFFLWNDFHKGKRFHVIASVISYTFVIGLTLSITEAASNTNCAFQPCISFFPHFSSLLVYHFVFIILLSMVYIFLYCAIPKLISKMKIAKRKSVWITSFFFGILSLITIGKYLTF